MFNSYHFAVLCKKFELVGKRLLHGHQFFDL